MVRQDNLKDRAEQFMLLTLWKLQLVFSLLIVKSWFIVDVILNMIVLFGVNQIELLLAKQPRLGKQLLPPEILELSRRERRGPVVRIALALTVSSTRAEVTKSVKNRTEKTE